MSAHPKIGALGGVGEIAHESGVFVAPYRAVLADGGSYATPSRTQRLARAAHLLWRLCRRMVVGIRYLDREGHPIHVRSRRILGELRGWLAMCDRYAELCDRVHELQRRRLRDRRHARTDARGVLLAPRRVRPRARWQVLGGAGPSPV